MWQSSSKPGRGEDDDESNLLHIASLGFAGLLMEAVGVWILFSWFTAPPLNPEDPRLLIGAVIAFIGFVVITRWLAALVKTLVK